jgi:hypothetical protein
MAGQEGQMLAAMCNGYISLNGSKAFFAGLDLEENTVMESLSEKEQNELLVRRQKLGEKRKKEFDKKVAQLAKQGKVRTVSVTINGAKVSGELDWNRDKTGLRARIALPIETGVELMDAKAKKVSRSKFAGLPV